MRIGLIGSHGTGKSTLVTELLKKLPQYSTVKEKSRGVLDKGLGLNFKTTQKTQLSFIQSYITMFEFENNSNILTSRTLVDLYAYTYYFANHREYDVNLFLLSKINALLLNKLSWWDLFFYIPIEFKQTETNQYREGQREHPEYQIEIDYYIQKTLNLFKVPFITLKGTVEERTKKILTEVKKCQKKL